MKAGYFFLASGATRVYDSFWTALTVKGVSHVARANLKFAMPTMTDGPCDQSVGFLS